MTLDLGVRQPPGLPEFIVGEQAEHIRLMGWLANWVSGDPHAAAQAWGASLGAYLQAEVGAGKTHLLQGALSEVVMRGWGGIALGPQQCQMWDPIDPAWPTLAVIDDCNRLPPEHQHLAFNLFLQAAESRASAGAVPDGAGLGLPGGALYILAAGLVPPAQLAVRDDLRTRLAWGLHFSLTPLDDEGVRLALSREAARRGLPLPDELLHHLLTRFSRNLGQLMALLDRLDDYALAAHRSPTVPLLKQMLALETP
ncbi:MAG: DnaA regulatory inactivator Hda [Pseudomonadota bacterium]|jgi:DnaA family protein